MPVSTNPLHERSMLFRLSIKVWSATAKDHEVTREIIESKGVSDQTAARVSKTLLPSNPRLKAIKKIAGKARNFNYEQTLPWYQDGTCLLPSRRFNDHNASLKALQHEFDHEVKLFTAEYHDAIMSARSVLGKMFRDDDYPDASVLLEKFQWEMEYTPVPDADDFRVTLGTSQMSDIKKKLETRLKDELQTSNQVLYERLHKLVEHMATKLLDPKGKFKDSITGNISNLTRIIPDLNLAGDREIERLAQEAANLTDSPAQALRDDEDIRKAKSEDARKLADELKARMEVFTK